MDLPVDVDASFCEHEEPEIHETGLGVHGGETVVDEHPAVRQPQRSEDDDHHHQHLHHLKTFEISSLETRYDGSWET